MVCQQNRVGLAHKDDPIIVGWMHGDEPDNAQAVVDRATGRGLRSTGYPRRRSWTTTRHCVPRTPPGRSCLTWGRGWPTTNGWAVGRGQASTIIPAYVKGCDIVSFDVYPVAGLDRHDSDDLLWYVAKGVDRLVKWTGGRKQVWNCIECTHISNPRPRPRRTR